MLALPKNPRIVGLLKLIAGSAGFALIFWLVMTYGDEPDFSGYRGPVGVAMIAVLPGLYALMGLIEVCTGLQFGQLAGRWDALSGWKRWLIGAVIIVLAIAIMLGAIAAAIYYGLI